MDMINSILWSLIANGIGLILPYFINKVSGKQIVKDEECNWFYGTLILMIACLMICQYTSKTSIRFICNIMAGACAYLTFLFYKTIYTKYKKLTLTKTSNKKQKRKHK